jgi:hypothetical protein
LAAALVALLIVIAGGAWWFLDANSLGTLALIRLWSEFEQWKPAGAPTENPEASADQTGRSRGASPGAGPLIRCTSRARMGRQ